MKKKHRWSDGVRCRHYFFVLAKFVVCDDWRRTECVRCIRIVVVTILIVCMRYTPLLPPRGCVFAWDEELLSPRGFQHTRKSFKKGTRKEENFQLWWEGKELLWWTGELYVVLSIFFLNWACLLSRRLMGLLWLLPIIVVIYILTFSRGFHAWLHMQDISLHIEVYEDCRRSWIAWKPRRLGNCFPWIPVISIILNPVCLGLEDGGHNCYYGASHFKFVIAFISSNYMTKALLN